MDACNARVPNHHVFFAVSGHDAHVKPSHQSLVTFRSPKDNSVSTMMRSTSEAPAGAHPCQTHPAPYQRIRRHHNTKTGSLARRLKRGSCCKRRDREPFHHYHPALPCPSEGGVWRGV